MPGMAGRGRRGGQQAVKHIKPSWSSLVVGITQLTLILRPLAFRGWSRLVNSYDCHGCSCERADFWDGQI